MRKQSVLLAIAIIALTTQAIPHDTHSLRNSPSAQTINQSPAITAGLIYISPPSSPSLPMGSKFNVSIQVWNMSSFNAWGVVVWADPAVIQAVNMSIAGNLMDANYTGYHPSLILECINGHPVVGFACNPTFHGPGDAEIGAGVQGAVNLGSQIAGHLYNITYKVVGPVGYTSIRFEFAQLANGTPYPVPLDKQSGTYGTPEPDFLMSANPNPAIIPQGSTGLAIITFTSINNFTGVVSLTVSGVPGFLGARLQDTSLKLSRGGSNSTNLILNASLTTPSSQYQANVTAIGGGRSHNFPLPVFVQNLPFFELLVNPSILKIHAGLSANTTVEVQGEVGFQGIVNLTLQVPTTLGVSAVLGSSKLAVPAGSGIVETSLNISTPAVTLPFYYQINVTASAMGKYGVLESTQTLIVRPPAASLLVTLNPSAISVRQGESSTTTILVSSADYFYGFVYVTAQMSGGTAGFDRTVVYVALASSSHATYTPSGNFTITVTAGRDTIPGNYLVLLTVYSVTDHNQAAVTKQLAIPVTIQNSIPLTILGLSPPMYFGILGALLIPLALLTVLTIRKGRAEKKDDDWRS